MNVVYCRRFCIYVAKSDQGIGGRRPAVRVRGVQRGEQRHIRSRQARAARLGHRR